MKKTILIVEDDPFIKVFYEQFFKRTDYKVIILEDGEQIISTLSSEKISILIMDINLRNTYLKGVKIDGIKLSEYIKRDLHLVNLPVLLVTAYSDSRMLKNLLNKKIVADFIVKPIVNFNYFLNKIDNLVCYN